MFPRPYLSISSLRALKRRSLRFPKPKVRDLEGTEEMKPCVVVATTSATM